MIELIDQNKYTVGNDGSIYNEVDHLKEVGTNFGNAFPEISSSLPGSAVSGVKIDGVLQILLYSH